MKRKQLKTPQILEDLIPDPAKRSEMISRLYKGDAILGKDGIFTDLLQTLVNTALEGELSAHLSESSEVGLSNRRNGHTHKKVRSSGGSLSIQTPRDRLGTHEPKLIKKWDRELPEGIDDIILSLYARGQSVEDVRYQLRQLYGLEISTGTISTITDRVWSEITAWQQRPLPSCFTVLYLDAIHFKVREDSCVKGKAIYTCYGVTCEGERDVLGLYLGNPESAREWGLILEDIKNRGVEDVLIFCIDGLTGFKDVIEEVYPNSIVQRCIVHMIRNSVRFVREKDLRAVCGDLRKIYKAVNRQQAEVALKGFGEKWDAKYKEIRPKWESNWSELMSFQDFGAHLRRMIYTTNPVEALHRVIRKITKTKGAWSSENGLIKQLYLALKHNQKSWKRKAFGWVSIQRELIEKFGDRYEKHL